MKPRVTYPKHLQDTPFTLDFDDDVLSHGHGRLTIFAKCENGHIGKMPINTRGGKIPGKELVHAHFRHKGWQISNRQAWCAECVALLRQGWQKEEVVPEKSKTHLKDAIQAIAMVYKDGTGYEAGYSDEKVAKETDLSPEYIASVREEYFGPAFIKDDALTKEVGDLMTDLHNLIENSTALSAQTLESMGRLNKLKIALDQDISRGSSLLRKLEPYAKALGVK